MTHHQTGKTEMTTKLKTARLVAAIFGALFVSSVAVGAAVAPAFGVEMAPATQVSSQIV